MRLEIEVGEEVKLKVVVKDVEESVAELEGRPEGFEDSQRVYTNNISGNRSYNNNISW